MAPKVKPAAYVLAATALLLAGAYFTYFYDAEKSQPPPQAPPPGAGINAAKSEVNLKARDFLRVNADTIDGSFKIYGQSDIGRLSRMRPAAEATLMESENMSVASPFGAFYIKHAILAKKDLGKGRDADKAAVCAYINSIRTTNGIDPVYPGDILNMYKIAYVGSALSCEKYPLPPIGSPVFSRFASFQREQLGNLEDINYNYTLLESSMLFNARRILLLQAQYLTGGITRQERDAQLQQLPDDDLTNLLFYARNDRETMYDAIMVLMDEWRPDAVLTPERCSKYRDRFNQYFLAGLNTFGTTIDLEILHRCGKPLTEEQWNRIYQTTATSYYNEKADRYSANFAEDTFMYVRTMKLLGDTNAE